MSDAGSAKSVSGGAIRASYRIDASRDRPSSWATQASNVASATDSWPGTQAFDVSRSRDPDFARLSDKVAASSGPPFAGFQCSVSSATMNELSAPSAAVTLDVI